MPRQENILSVFVASPGDVLEERSVIEDVIRDLNLTWSREFGVRLEVVKWETHALPGIGQDAQDVINNEIPEDYDIFIGIMWHRFGTPTGRAGSGTAEEFERATERFERDSSNLQIMMYFKDSPPQSLSDIDPHQLDLVNKFRVKLGKEGVLYWRYNQFENFEQLVRLHLSRYIQKWNNTDKISINAEVFRDALKSDGTAVESVRHEDDGIIDLLEMLEDELHISTESMNRIAIGTVSLGEKINKHADILVSIKKTSNTSTRIGREKVKRAISEAASEMIIFAEEVRIEIPIYKQSMNNGLNAFLKIIELSDDFQEAHERSVYSNDTVRTIDRLISSIDLALSKIIDFQSSVAKIPRLTSDMNTAKRAVISAHDHLIFEIESAKSLFIEARSALKHQ